VSEFAAPLALGPPKFGVSGIGAHACRARVMMDLRARGCYHGDRACME